MGLDMYLYAKKCCSHMSWSSSEERKGNFDKVVELMNAADFVDKDRGYVPVYIELQVAYWRKANAIHQFFVELDEGKDECQEIYVERDVLQELLNHCNTILENNDVEKAKSLLPTQSGFFFGGTEYDEYYFEELRYTQKILKKLIDTAPEDWEFYYQASW